MPKVGDTLANKYRLVGLLGEGGMSEVFAAEDTWMSRRVAIKTLLPNLVRSERIVQRFWQEARIASQLDHRNIVRVIDIGIDASEGVPFIVQELLEGQSLKDYLNDTPGGRLRVAEAVALLLPVMAALVAVHKQGVLHRDIKPGNIFVTRDSQGDLVPKIIDFGISKIIAEAESGLIHTRTGAPIGTPLYMSPEQASGDKSTDAQSDVWSVGVVLYEMLTGRCPYEGANHNVIIAKILRDRPARIETHAPELSPGLVEVIRRALERNRERRFRTMFDFLTALREAEASDAMSAEFELRSVIDRTSQVALPPGPGGWPEEDSLAEEPTVAHVRVADAMRIGPVAIRGVTALSAGRDDLFAREAPQGSEPRVAASPVVSGTTPVSWSEAPPAPPPRKTLWVPLAAVVVVAAVLGFVAISVRSHNTGLPAGVATARMAPASVRPAAIVDPPSIPALSTAEALTS